MEVRLPDGSSLRARGRIDRVDQVGGAEANVFAIWDYKTGGTWKYTQNPRPFWEGRVVQHALSMLVMNARLKAMGTSFLVRGLTALGSFSRAKRAQANGSSSPRPSLNRGPKSWAGWLGSPANGAFLATTEHDQDCSFCDFRQICGNVTAVASASSRKLISALERDPRALPESAQ